MSKHLLIFGLGYTAKFIKRRAEAAGWQVRATGSDGDLDFSDRHAVEAALKQATYVLSSVPPDRKSGEDPVLNAYFEEIFEVEMGTGEGVFYLSSTGVYGDQQGGWVDERTPTVAESSKGRRNARAEADQKWLQMGARVFRLPGIYGPGRSVFDRIRDGRAKRIAMPGQVFSRVHVEDIASGVMAALEDDAPRGAYNLADNLPCSQNALIEHACMLLGREPPPLMTLEEANLSPMARGFYAENRRVANGKAKNVLGWELTYPTFREGLASLLQSSCRPRSAITMPSSDNATPEAASQFQR